MPRPPEPERRDALLEACFAAAQDAGSTDPSLAWLAERTGTSARMLVYHFGSREGLRTALAERLEAELRRRFAAGPEAGDPRRAALALWALLAAPEMRGLLGMVADAMHRASRGDPAAAALAEREAAEWGALLEARMEDPDRALALLLLVLGAAHDLLATGDAERGRRAIGAFFG